MSSGFPIIFTISLLSIVQFCVIVAVLNLVEDILKVITKKELLQIKKAMTRDEASSFLGVSKSTYYNMLKRAGIKVANRKKKYKIVDNKGV